MEGDAGASRLNPIEGQERSDSAPDNGADDVTTTESAVEHDPELLEPQTEQSPEIVGDTRRPSRLGVGWVGAVAIVVLLAAVGLGVGGYFALRSNEQTQDISRIDAAAVEAAKDCVSATQAPDTAAMTAAQTRIVDCSTGDFGVQAGLYSSVMVDAYQAANVKVQVSDMRAAVERHNDNGSIDVLVAMKVKVTNSAAADQEQGYRLRVQMAPVDGTYKIADLEQVTS